MAGVYVFCRRVATTVDVSVGHVSRLEPMDARQQPMLASTTDVLDAVLQKHSPSRKSSALLHRVATTMDGSVGNVSILKPMDARQQPMLASTTDALYAVL